MKRLAPVVAFTALLTALAGLIAVQRISAGLAPPKPRDHSPHDIVISPHTRLPAIARKLRREGLIRDVRLFRLAARWLHVDRRLQAGGYRFTPADGTLRILRALAEGKVCVCKLTLPEGLTLAEVAQRLEDEGLVQADVFLAYATGRRPLEDRPSWAPPGSLEGYLFPETYQVPLGTTEPELLRMFLHRFGETVVEGMATDLKAQPLSLHEAVTLASIVEREAKLPEERPLMARVFLNRLSLGWRLESCATVQYALPQRKPKLTYADLKVDSPYNTYLHDGLPPGPIASPGAPSLRAVLKPAATTALYFVARPDGSHVFSRTLAQHDAAKRTLRQTVSHPKPP